MPGKRILIVEDDKNQAETLAKILSLEGYRTRTAFSGRKALAELQEQPVDLILSDLRLGDIDGMALFREAAGICPGVPFILITAHGSIDGAVAALQEGVFHYLTKPIDSDELVSLLQRALEMSTLRDENRALRQQIAQHRAQRKIVGSGQAMTRLMEMVEQVAVSDATVLIRGETGTGKELIADAVHSSSRRAEGPLIKVNCAAIPDNLLEDELFGHEKGAFTGAHTDRKGRFELADGGTLFLDEIGEMPANLQVKVLRILQERQFERLGGSRTVRVDVRIVAATNRNLEELVRERQFREDLYYRINVVPLHLPPLRERREDIPILANHFLKFMNRKNGRDLASISRPAMDKLMAYHWPGNVRELENCIERGVVMAQGPEIGADDLPLEPLRTSPAAGDLYDLFFAANHSLDELEKNLITEGLRRSGGNQSAAAKLLGLTRRTLQYRTEKYGIPLPGRSGPAPPAPPRPDRGEGD